MQEAKHVDGSLQLDEDIDPMGWVEDLQKLTVDQLRADYSWRTANNCYLTCGEPVMANAAAAAKWDLLTYLLDLRMPSKEVVDAVTNAPDCPLYVFEQVVDAYVNKLQCHYCDEPRCDCIHSEYWVPDFFLENLRRDYLRDKLVDRVCANYQATKDAKAKVALLLTASSMDSDSLLQLLPPK